MAFLNVARRQPAKPRDRRNITTAGRGLAVLVPLLTLGVIWQATGGSAGAQPVARPSGSVISGTVVDSATGRPIDEANVFLGSTMLGASTEQDGRFVLRGIPNGSYRLACSRVGYTRRLIPVEFTVADSMYLDISLVQRPISMDTVRVTGMRPDEWRRYLKVFLAAFLGTRPNAEQCALLNPEVLDFRLDRRTGLLTAATDSTLRVENRALGYRLDVLLLEFSWDVRTDNGHWAILPRFTPYDSLDAEHQARWTKNRRDAFDGSLEHFLAALASGRPEDQGFVSGARGRGLPPKRPKLAPVPGTSLISVTFSDWLRVEYIRSIPPTKGTIKLVENCAVIDSLGNNFTPYCFEIAGDWAEYGVADLLPRDWR
jgi:hypothetical protein